MMERVIHSQDGISPDADGGQQGRQASDPSVPPGPADSQQDISAVGNAAEAAVGLPVSEESGGSAQVSALESATSLETVSPADRISENEESRPIAPSAGDRRFLSVVLTVFTVCFTVQWIQAVRAPPKLLELERGDAFRQEFRVDVNTATWIEWMQLEGIGISLANRIQADRELNGPFETIDDVQRVPGIGTKTLDRIRPWLTISHEHEIIESQRQPSRDIRSPQPASGE